MSDAGQQRGCGGRGVGRGFTLTELLAVITIIVVLISVAVPAFVGMLRSTNQALALSNFRIGIASARDAAVRSAGLADAAAVFFYEPGGRTTIQTCIAVGELNGLTVWVPDPLSEAVSLPPGWMVGGFAPAGTIAPAGSGSGPTPPGSPALWYESADDRYDATRDNWVFPESGFYRTANAAGRDTTPANHGEYRQTFMIRFDGRTGGVALDDRGMGLVFAPDNEIGRGAAPWRLRGSSPQPVARYRYDGSMRADEYVRRILNRPWGTGLEDPADLDLLLGKNSSDAVLVRPTTMVALYNVRDLAQEMVRQGAVAGFRGVNRVTGCLYDPPANAASATPDYEFPWADEVNASLPAVARVFTVERYNGGVVEVTP